MDRILIVDDLPSNIKILGELLKEQYDIIVASNGNKALQIALNQQPDLILMDVMMADIDGFTACRLLKKQATTAEIPILFITASTASEDVLNGFKAGGQDYITKPFNPAELYARVQNHIELGKSRKSIRAYAKETEKINQELKQLLEQVDILSRHDPLTGAANRRDAIEKINTEIARHKRNKQNFSLVIVDIDDFKLINDNYGHEAGDFILQHLVKLMQDNLRQQDLVARWGGDEFLIMLPETSGSEAKQVVEKIQGLVKANDYIYNCTSITITATAGVAQFDPNLELRQNLDRADQALYLGKRKAKNCVMLA